MRVTQEPGSLKQLTEQFLVYCGARNLSGNTLKAYRVDLGDLLSFAGDTELSRKMVRGFVASLHNKGLSARSARRKLAAVKSLCKWLEQEGVIEPGTIRSVRGPRMRDQLPDVPSEAEVLEFLEGDIPGACPERDRLIAELLYGCGLRAAEVIGLNVDDQREGDAILVRGKGRKERVVPMGEYARNALEGWLQLRQTLLRKRALPTQALLFSVRPHRVERLEVRTVGRVIKAIAELRGLDPNKWHPHLLRHACGTHMFDKGAPLQAVAQMLGHSKLSTAQIYTRVSVRRMMHTYKSAHPHAQGQETFARY